MNQTLPKCGHSILQRACGHCIAFKRKWNDTVERSGLQNIEQEDGNLKTWASSAAQKATVGRMEAARGREEYYRAAGHFLWDYNFERELDRRIWEAHASGISALDISKSLKMRKKGKDTILKTINRLAGIMGVKCRK